LCDLGAKPAKNIATAHCR